MLACFLAGVAQFRTHLRGIGFNNESDCRFCNEGEEIQYLLESDAFAYRRLYCLGTNQVEETNSSSSRDWALVKYFDGRHLHPSLVGEHIRSAMIKVQLYFWAPVVADKNQWLQQVDLNKILSSLFY